MAVRIGIIGIGFMGMTHFEGTRQVKGGRIAAIATRDPKKLAGDWTSIQGNFGPPGGHVDLTDRGDADIGGIDPVNERSQRISVAEGDTGQRWYGTAGTSRADEGE